MAASTERAEEDVEWFDGMWLSYEHGYLCVRDEKGWLLWSVEGNAMPHKGLSLRSVVMESVKNQHINLPRNPREA